MNETIELDLKEIGTTLIKRLWALILCAVIGGLAMLTYTVNFVTPTYKSGVTMYVNNSSGVNGQYMSSSDLAVAQRLVETYINIIASHSVLDKVVEASGLEDLTAEQLRGMLAASAVGETEMFTISVIAPDPQMAADLANVIAQVAPGEIAKIIPGSSAKVVDYARIPKGRYAPSYTSSTVLGFLAGGAVSLGRGEYLAKMSRRAQRYILAIGTADTMPLSEIAKRVNRTPDKAAKELQKLIDKGLLGEDSYIDYEKGYFARFGAVVEDEEPVITEVPKEAEEGYSGILRNLRLANDRIPDEALSSKIERLEQISALIFKEVEAHPEKRDRIRTFFDYYLPTTQKLLDTYAEFDEMGVEGENMTQAKARIAEMMDSIVEGFEHQLDQLYSADAMDVVSDIKVMETMLSRDTASAAKDFGYQKKTLKDESKPQQLEM